MTTANIGLFTALGAKMDFVNQRQAVISQNIANASTPGYIARDLTGGDFRAMVDSLNLDRNSTQSPVATHASHSTQAGGVDVDNGDVRNQRTAYEVTPSGNAVVIEEQMIKASENVMDYNIVTNLIRRNVGMMRLAIQGNG